MIVRKSFIRYELIEKIHRITKINPSEYKAHLACKWPVSHGNCQAVWISDDDDYHAILELYSSEHSIELYILRYTYVILEGFNVGHLEGVNR